MGFYKCDPEKGENASAIEVKQRVKELIKRRIPILGWLPSYTVGLFLQDLLAGFTVGLTEIPQGISYAVIAGLPTQYGLYSGIMGCFLYIIIGSCNVINVGPTAVMSFMVRTHVNVLGPSGAVLICFLSGCFILLAGILRLGFVVEFFSFPVTVGFTTAAAIEIACSQLKTLMGISSGSNITFLDSWKAVINYGYQTRKWDLILGSLTILFLFIVKEFGKRYGTLSYRPDWTKRRNNIGRAIYIFSLASNAIAVIIGTSIAYVCNQKGYSPFLLTGVVKKGLPPFTLPPFSDTVNGTYYSFSDMLDSYGASLGFIPVIAVVEHIAIAKAFSKGRSVDATQEFISLGICNIMSSFVQSMPVTGSFTRTTVNNASGARTTVSGVITGIMVVFALAFLTSSFAYIPKSTLAGVIIVAMYYLAEFAAIRSIWRTKKLDLIPMVVTITCCLLISLEYGILIGIATNMVFLLYSSARPKLQIEEIQTPHGDGFVVTFKTGLHFAAAEYIREKILRSCYGEDTTVIINGQYLGNIDATVARSLYVLKQELQIRKQKLVFLNFKQSVRECASGIDESLGQHFKLGTLEQVLEGMETVTVWSRRPRWSALLATQELVHYLDYLTADDRES